MVKLCCPPVVLTAFVFSTCSTDEGEGTVCLNLLLKKTYLQHYLHDAHVYFRDLVWGF